jgi:hypothetical protein
MSNSNYQEEEIKFRFYIKVLMTRVNMRVAIMNLMIETKANSLTNKTLNLVQFVLEVKKFLTIQKTLITYKL